MKHNFEDDIKKALAALNSGGLILYPTDTIWGLGCDANNEKAVNRIYKVKKRHHSKSMIVLLDTVDKLSLYVEDVPEIAYELINQVQTPTTLIYPKAKNLAKNVIATDGSIAIRIIKDDFCSLLCKLFEKPLVSTSANISGYGNPVFFRDIPEELIKKVDYTVEFGRDRIKQIKPSTLIKLTGNWEYEILRD